MNKNLKWIAINYLLEEILHCRRINIKYKNLKKNCNRCKANYSQYSSNHKKTGCKLKYQTFIREKNEFQLPIYPCPKPIIWKNYEKEAKIYRKEKKEIYKFLFNIK